MSVVIRENVYIAAAIGSKDINFKTHRVPNALYVANGRECSTTTVLIATLKVCR